MKKITVVIPNYNGIRYLDTCLESLSREEQNPEYEILVVDNGSTDGSVELLQDKWAQIRTVFLSENTGFCHAVNVGIKDATTPYVLLLNNDTKVQPGFLKSLYEAIEADEKIFSVSSKMLMWDDPNRIDDAGDRYSVFGWAYSRGKGKSAAEYDRPCEVFAACGGASLYRRDVFEKIGFFDELHFAYMEDIDIGYRALIYGYRNVYEPKAEVIHYGSAASGSRYNEWKTRIAAANNVYLIGKNMPFLQWLINLPFQLVGFFLKFLFFCRKRMGKLYLKGLLDGVKKTFSKEGRKAKVRFRIGHLPQYVKIQLRLYAGAMRIIKKS